ncbi:MAG: GtrA family protein [Desulfovibrio sp.]|nr:GtrA family protein [Desulfovibrio sp.]
MRFGAVGGTSSIVYGSIGLLTVKLMGLPVLVGNTIAYVISFVVSYLGQSLLTFQAHLQHKSMLPKYMATQGIGFGLNSVIIWVLTGIGLAYEYAMPIAIFLVPVVVYMLCKYWVFPQSQRTETLLDVPNLEKSSNVAVQSGVGGSGYSERIG